MLNEEDILCFPVNFIHGWLLASRDDQPFPCRKKKAMVQSDQSSGRAEITQTSHAEKGRQELFDLHSVHTAR